MVLLSLFFPSAQQNEFPDPGAFRSHPFFFFFFFHFYVGNDAGENSILQIPSYTEKACC